MRLGVMKKRIEGRKNFLKRFESALNFESKDTYLYVLVITN